MKSTVIVPQVVRRLSSTRNFRLSFSYTLSFSFGSSRAKPNEGPAQPPCIRATRRAESILFCSIYSLSFSTAKSVTLKSDMMPPRFNTLATILKCFRLNFLKEVVSVPTQNKVLQMRSQSRISRNRAIELLFVRDMWLNVRCRPRINTIFLAKLKSVMVSF